MKLQLCSYRVNIKLTHIVDCNDAVSAFTVYATQNWKTYKTERNSFTLLLWIESMHAHIYTPIHMSGLFNLLYSINRNPI